jgi:hypothetical protein
MSRGERKTADIARTLSTIADGKQVRLFGWKRIRMSRLMPRMIISGSKSSILIPVLFKNIFRIFLGRCWCCKLKVRKQIVIV